MQYQTSLDITLRFIFFFSFISSPFKIFVDFSRVPAEFISVLFTLRQKDKVRKEIGGGDFSPHFAVLLK